MAEVFHNNIIIFIITDVCRYVADICEVSMSSALSQLKTEDNSFHPEGE